MNKFLEQVDDEMRALDGDIPSQNFKLALKDLINQTEASAFPTNTTSESTKDQLKVKWNDQIFLVDIKHVPAEDESISAAEVVDDAGEQYDNEKDFMKKLKNRQGKEASTISKEYKTTVIDDAIKQIKDQIADYGKNK